MRFEFEKSFHPDQRRDSHGRWTSGAGGRRVGEQNHPATRVATVQRLTIHELEKMPQAQLENHVMRILKAPGGNTLSGIYAHASQAFGVVPDKKMTSVIDRGLKGLAASGKLEVKKEIMAERHGKDTEGLTTSGRLKAGSVKWGFDKTTGEFVRLEREQYTISLKGDHGKNLPKLPVPPHTLGVTRPDRFEPEKGSLAQKTLDYRRQTYPDTKMSPMGRYFSSMKESPEMMLGEDKQAKGKFNRNEYFAKKGIFFFDATSSVTAHVGAMTGDRQSLMASKLIKSEGTPKHHELAQKLGIKAKDTNKPYFASLSGTNPANALTPEDFKGLKADGHAIKAVAKTIWTPSSYGSPLGMATSRAITALKQGGMTDETLIKATARKLTQNFKETQMYNFTPQFKSIISEAPDNFVYTNPMSGFKMSFNEFKTYKHEVILGGHRITASIPTHIGFDKRGVKKMGAAAPLFIQNWDAAVISQLMKDMKSPHTAHDAIGIKKAYQKDLNKAVVKAMNTVKNHNPIKDLANQILRQHLKNGMSREEYRKLRARLLGKVVKMTHGRSQISDFTVNPDVGNNHFQPEF